MKNKGSSQDGVGVGGGRVRVKGKGKDFGGVGEKKGGGGQIRSPLLLQT